MITYQVIVIVLATLGAFLFFREVIIAQGVERDRTKLEKLKGDLLKILEYEKDPNEYMIRDLMFILEVDRAEAINYKNIGENSPDPWVKDTINKSYNDLKNLDYKGIVKKIKWIDKNLDKISVKKMQQRKVLLLSGIILIIISAVLEIYLILRY